MLDPRLYRAALVPVLLALIVCAFSLGDRPRPIGTTLATDAFSQVRAVEDLKRLVAAYPLRRAGDAGDERLAQELARMFRGMGTYQVSTPAFDGETSEGSRRLTTVVARQIGSAGPSLVVVAHRDAVGRGALAELSGTAAMLELARVVADGKLRRTITFVSTSGGSGGLAGARDLARHLSGPTDAVLVLGDLIGTLKRRPFVVPWSTGQGFAPLQLRRTVEAAVRAEAGTNPGGPRVWRQWANLALPLAVGEQGPLLDDGLPAVLLSVSGERPPPATTPIVPERLGTYGRVALRTLIALDNGPDLDAGPERGVVTMRKVLPPWAARLLVATLLLAPLLVAVDALARVRRRREPVGTWVAWIGATALPVVAALVFAAFLGWTGLLPATPPVAVPDGGIPFGGAAKAATVAIVLVGALVAIVGRPAALAPLGAIGRLEGPGAAVALLLTWCTTAALVWVVNPYAAMLLVPGAHALLALAAPSVRLRRGPALVLVGVAVLPVLLVLLTQAARLDLGAGDVAWLLLLLVAGGGIGLGTVVVWSVLLSCLLAAVLLALRVDPAPAPDGGDVTVRGPVGYAGPGSLGGTESALRR